MKIVIFPYGKRAPSKVKLSHLNLIWIGQIGKFLPSNASFRFLHMIFHFQILLFIYYIANQKLQEECMQCTNASLLSMNWFKMFDIEIKCRSIIF